MGLGKELRARVSQWDRLSRWERAELGRALRLHGLSYGEIMRLVPVKKSTLATWCQGVALSEEQWKAIKTRTGSVVGRPRDTQRRRRAEIVRIRANARESAQHLVHDPLWVAGVALYWGEGFKTRSTMGMANSDPAALRLFIKWAKHFHDSDARFKAKLNLHAANDERQARQFWSGALGIELEDFNKTFIKPDGTGHRKNHLHAGVCQVTMRQSADALHRTLAWVEFLKMMPGTNM